MHPIHKMILNALLAVFMLVMCGVFIERADWPWVALSGLWGTASLFRAIHAIMFGLIRLSEDEWRALHRKHT